MKIAVYTISKNEEQFVRRWADSCVDGDFRLILDTGSTDGSAAAYEKAFAGWESNAVVARQEFTPWRFDTARNHALDLLPDDIDLCVALDMDEVLLPGWREALEALEGSVTRPRYKYVWSWNPDGSEGLVYGGDKIHARHGFRWKHPVHEVLVADAGEVQGWCELVIHHHPDPTKSRGQYLPLLELAVQEDPDDDRNLFYLGREYMFSGRFAEAVPLFEKHLLVSKWPPERAASHRWLAKAQPERAEFHLWRAVAEDPGRRESWVDLALHFYRAEDWLSCRFTAERALRIEDKPLDYLCEAFAWGAVPFDLAALSAHKLGDSDAAFAYGAEACALEPGDERLATNLMFYRS